MECTTWKELFEQMKDPRQARGKRYPWWVLLIVITAALMSGETIISGVIQWVQERRQPPEETVWKRMPSGSTLRRALQQTDAEQAWRGHRTIENRVHYVRDVTFDEDASQIAKEHAPQALAAFRNGILSHLRSLGYTNIPQALRHPAVSFQRPLALLGLLL